MIICHSRKFVLIRPRKVASSSVQWALVPHLAKGDLVMQADESELDAPLETEAIVGHFTRRWPRVLRAHSPLSRLVAVMGTEILSYRIITLARNPWDRAVSEFYFDLRATDMRQRPPEVQRQAFEAWLQRHARLTRTRRVFDWLEGRQRKSRMDQSELCFYQGRFRADHVLFYEDLEAGIAEVGAALQIDLRLPQRKAKAGIRAEVSKSWQDFYSRESRTLVAEVCQSDIDRYGYDFEGTARPAFQKV